MPGTDDDKPRTGTGGTPLPRRIPGVALAAAERAAGTARSGSSNGHPRTLGSIPDDRLLRRISIGLESMR